MSSKISILRWTPKRKREIVQDIADGDIGFDGACALYEISAEELNGWIGCCAEGSSLRVTNRYRPVQVPT